jgi:serine/threonine protein kinase
MLSRLSHRNLPRIYDHFTDPTHWYVVMQYIEGETLEDSLKRAKEGHLPLKQVRDIGGQLSNVLSYLHAQTPSIIFRDVKPSNIPRIAQRGCS